CSDVIHRRGRLVVPVTPGFAAIGGNHGALVAHCEDDIGVVGIDPALLIIVAAGRPAYRRPGEPPVFGAPENGGATVDYVLVLRVDRDGGQVASTDAAQRPCIGRTALRAGLRDAGILGSQEPMVAAVGGFVE